MYLCHCKGIDMDETMLVTRLEAFGIPCLRQYPNDGQFGKLILGISGSGVDIFGSRLGVGGRLRADPGERR